MKRRLENMLAVPHSSFLFDAAIFFSKILAIAVTLPLNSFSDLPSGAMSRSWKQKKSAFNRLSVSNIMSAFTRAAAMASGMWCHSRMKVSPPKGSSPGQHRVCQ